LEARTQELARSVEQLRSLAEVSQSVNATLDLDQVLATIVASAVQLSGTDSGIVYEFHEQENEFRPRATHGFSRELIDLLLATPLRIGDGATGRAAATRAPVQIPDILVEGAYPARCNRRLRRRVCARCSRPAAARGRCWAVLRSGAGPRASSRRKSSTCSRPSPLSPLAIENARLFREIERKSRELKSQASTSRSSSPT
jgi:transcriptional regulator with GAF, ATPase, and Fis domain